MRLSISDCKEGPIVLEKRLSDKILPMGKYPDNKLAWYKELISIIKPQQPGFWKKDKIVYNLSLGYLYYQSTQYILEGAERKSFLLSALEYNKAVTGLSKKNRELEFYAVFLQGIIMEMLGRPWPEVEQVYIHAHEVYPGRGESLVHLINHYFSEDQPQIAYTYTSYGKDHLFDHLPRNDKWILDTELYNWKILDMHIAAAYGMGKIDEAADTYITLLGRLETQPQLFMPEQAKSIREKQAFFMQSEDDEQEVEQSQRQ